MPTVPRAPLNYVPTAPLPHPHVGNAFEPPQPIDISPVTRLVQQIYDEEQAKADTTALIGADTQLATLHNTLLYDPDNGALTKTGADAAPASKAAMDAWQKGANEIMGSLSPNQQGAFQKVVAQRSQDLDSTLARHAATEIDRYKDDTTNANLAAERTATLQAYTDPTRVQQGIEHQKNVITLDGVSRGQSQEVINQRIADETSKIHSGVIHLLLADDKDIDATKYFEQHSKELDPQALLQAKDSLDLGTVRGESQRRADSIVQSTATLGGALAEAAKIADPKVREATENRIRRAFEDQDRSRDLVRSQAYAQASTILEQTHDTHRIPPDIWNSMSAEMHIQLEHREQQIRNPKRFSNPETYSTLMNMAGLSDSSRAQFMGLDLNQYRSDLDERDYKKLLNLQLSMRRESGRTASSEARRQDATAERQAAKDQQRARATGMLRAAGIDVPPTVPGGPLKKDEPNVPIKLSPKGLQVPQSWIDHASRSSNYKKYLEHMGVVFDTTAAPASRSTPSNGDINLK